MKKRLSTTIIMAAVLILAVVWSTPASAGRPVMVTICHAAGRAGEPAQWVELTLPYDSVYGPAGHFSEPGSTNAGHERDYEGPCVVEPTATPVPTAVPTEVEPTPTAIPTEIEPTPTEIEPTESVEPTPTEVEPTPTEVGPTPTAAVASTPPPRD